MLYSASGLYDVGINSAAVDLEQATGRRFMPLVPRGLLAAGPWPGRLGRASWCRPARTTGPVYLVLLVPLAVLHPGRRDHPVPAVHRTCPGGVGEDELTSDSTGTSPLLLVGGIATLGLGSEGEMEHWSGIYLRDTLGLSALLGGSGVAVFYAAMAVGQARDRLGVGRVSATAGPCLCAGLLTAAGMALALATREPVLVVAGFLVVGLALSAVAPIAFSVAGDLAPGRAGEAISVVTTLGYGGFLLGPVIVGGLAELVGLRSRS